MIFLMNDLFAVSTLIFKEIHFDSVFCYGTGLRTHF